ncbi:MAG: DUF5615 family PIN-like protein [Bacteroidota bacterium]
MKLLADECCAAPLVAALRKGGHNVLFVPEVMAGAADPDVLARAYDEDRLLLTEDKDFGELVVRLGLDTHGVVLLRFAEADGHLKRQRVLSLLDQHAERLRGRFVVVTTERFRFRPL